MSEQVPQGRVRLFEEIERALGNDPGIDTTHGGLAELVQALKELQSAQATRSDGEAIAGEAAAIARASAVAAPTGSIGSPMSNFVAGLRAKVASASAGVALLLGTAGVAVAAHAVLPDGLPSLLEVPAPLESPVDLPSNGTLDRPESVPSVTPDTDGSITEGDGTGNSGARGLDRAIEVVSTPKPATAKSGEIHIGVVSLLSLLNDESAAGGHLGELVADAFEPGPRSGNAKSGGAGAQGGRPEDRGPKTTTPGQGQGNGQGTGSGKGSNRP